MAKMLFGKPVAEQIYKEISAQCQKLPYIPRLGVVGFDNAQWLQYAGGIQKSAAQCGVNVESVTLPTNASKEDFRCAVRNTVAICNGVIVQQPLPAEMAEEVVVPVGKDVDCLTSASVAKLYRGEAGFRPATPSAVLALLDYYSIRLQGKNLVIIGRGDAVGKPLALMCLKRNATVTICHTKTVGLATICKNADIIISACGVAGLVTTDFVTEKSIVIDVGLSFVNGKTCGDVDAAVYDVVSAVSPVPGGIGPVTRAALLRNLMSALPTKK